MGTYQVHNHVIIFHKLLTAIFLSEGEAAEETNLVEISLYSSVARYPSPTYHNKFKQKRTNLSEST